MDAPDKQPAAFRLELAERNSPTWAKLRKHMQVQLEQLRRDNDADADPMKTAKLRGRIAQLKNLLALGNPPDPAMVADEEQGE